MSIERGAIYCGLLVVLCGCSLMPSDYERDRSILDKYVVAESDGISWKVLNGERGYEGDGTYSYQDIEILNDEEPYDWRSNKVAEKLAYESTRLRRSKLTKSDLKSGGYLNDYDPGTERYRGVVGYKPHQIRHTEGTPHVPHEKDRRFERRWYVRLSVKSTEEICDWVVDEENYNYPCDEFFINVSPEGSNVSVTANGKWHNVFVNPYDVVVAVVGDSYISGEGTGSWSDSRCHRSEYAWPSLLAARYAIENPHVAVHVISRACSGADIKHVLDTPYRGPGRIQLEAVSNDGPSTTPAQIEQIKADLCNYLEPEKVCESAMHIPDVILLSIGGNDASFGPVIMATLAGKVDELKEDEIRLVENHRAALPKKLKNIRRDMFALSRRLESEFPGVPVLATNYLSPLHSQKDKLCSKEEDNGFFSGIERIFASILRFEATTAEIVALQNDYVEPLIDGDDSIREIHREISEVSETWRFVATASFEPDGSQSDGFETNGICLGSKGVDGRWFSTVSDSNAENRSFNGTMHPNIFGQLFYVGKVYPEFVRAIRESANKSATREN